MSCGRVSERAVDEPIAVTTTGLEQESVDERLQKIPLAELIGETPVHGKIVCPFHDDHAPSLHIYSDHYHCFVCGAHGDHLDWLCRVEGLAPTRL